MPEDQAIGDAKAINEKAKNIAAYRALYDNDTDYAKATPPTPAAKPKPNYLNPSAKYGDKPGENRNVATPDMLKPLGSFKKGGKVKKTGTYKLHAKERVVNKNLKPVSALLRAKKG